MLIVATDLETKSVIGLDPREIMDVAAVPDKRHCRVMLNSGVTYTVDVDKGSVESLVLAASDADVKRAEHMAYGDRPPRDIAPVCLRVG